MIIFENVRLSDALETAAKSNKNVNPMVQQLSGYGSQVQPQIPAQYPQQNLAQNDKFRLEAEMQKLSSENRTLREKIAVMEMLQPGIPQMSGSINSGVTSQKQLMDEIKILRERNFDLEERIGTVELTLETKNQEVQKLK